MSEQKLAGKVALVTGSARNIGRAIAHHLADDGADIVINGVSDRDAVDTVVKEIQDKGRNAIGCMFNVTDAAAVKEAAERAKNELGGIDILVVNASARGQVPFLEMTFEQFHDVVDISIDGMFHLAQACIPMMQEKGWGRIVTIGGVSWHVGTPTRVHNLVAKSGLSGFTRGLAVEFATDGITVNSVSPGFIDTVRPASAGTLPNRPVKAPVERMGTVDEVASMVHYLCLPESAYVTGQIMHVNGGMYLGGS
ncbi:MAG: SDR family oxidoreductase [Rhodospirillales bacterium]|nr:SDR family oxidoreductase [Rhodospirillales bacterium]MBO6788777.1 SDR family oxidoreductase [Rhodospirillales bacterium]